jgi:predicted ribosome quality control (RQC) complex YloA/Tae2 family protein
VDSQNLTRLEVRFGVEAWGREDDRDRALERDRAEWVARGAPLARDAARDTLLSERAAALRAWKQGVARLTRRREAVRGDLARIGEADALAQRAQWLVAEAARAPRGARSLRVTDWSTGEAQTIEVPLDPSKPARAQVDAMFQRARRLKLGAAIASTRLAQTEAALEALAPLEARLNQAEDVEAIHDAMAEAKKIAPKDVKLAVSANTSGAARARGPTAAPPFRTFHARSGTRLLVGRGAVHNDTLTFQVARPHDLWLHAKDRAGAHVVVPLAKNQTCPGDVLADAAHLAAHFSDARDEAVVDVQYASRRHLRKPRGSPPGFVVVDREKVIAVRIVPEVLRALLDGEEV